MQYMLLIHADEKAMPAVPTDKAYEMSSAYAAYTAALQKAGALVSGDRLKPSTSARIVKVRGKRTEVLDGPFADVKEQFGGYYVIEAGNLEAAVAWAEKCPGAGLGAIEVRPVWDSNVPAQ
jgi:hypothetical protein